MRGDAMDRIVIYTYYILSILNFVIAEKIYYGSVETIAKYELDAGPLRRQSLQVRYMFSKFLLDECRIIEATINALRPAMKSNNDYDFASNFDVVAGGFAGKTKPTFGYVVKSIIESEEDNDDDDDDDKIMYDIQLLGNALGYVLTQGSTFILDANDSSSFDFPANYAIMVFNEIPSIEDSKHFFELVGSIDDDMFATTSSGYTQYGTSYLSLQSSVSDQQFIDGYVKASRQVHGVQYSPLINNGSAPSLYQGGAAFPNNDWRTNPDGKEYLSRIPSHCHNDLYNVRNQILNTTQQMISIVREQNGGEVQNNETMLLDMIGGLTCPTMKDGLDDKQNDPPKPDNQGKWNSDYDIFNIMGIITLLIFSSAFVVTVHVKLYRQRSSSSETPRYHNATTAEIEEYQLSNSTSTAID